MTKPDTYAKGTSVTEGEGYFRVDRSRTQGVFVANIFDREKVFDAMTPGSPYEVHLKEALNAIMDQLEAYEGRKIR